MANVNLKSFIDQELVSELTERGYTLIKNCDPFQFDSVLEWDEIADFEPLNISNPNEKTRRF